MVSADSDIGLLLVRSVLAAGMAPRKLSQRASASERYAIVLQLAVQLAALLAVASHLRVLSIPHSDAGELRRPAAHLPAELADFFVICVFSPCRLAQWSFASDVP